MADKANGVIFPIVLSQLTTVQTAIEKHGYWAMVHANAQTPEVIFARSTELEENGLERLIGKIGYVFSNGEAWQVFLENERRTIDCSSVDEVLTCITEYLEIPTLQEPFQLHEDDPALTGLRDSIVHRGYWAEIRVKCTVPTIYFSLDGPFKDDVSPRWKSIYFSVYDRQWHLCKGQEETELVCESPADILCALFGS